MAASQRDMFFDAKMCTGCFKMCRFVCPTGIATKNESITPYGRSSAIHLTSINRMEYSSKAVEAMYQCATCGLCKTWCKPEVDVANMVEKARKTIVQKGLAPQLVINLNEITQKNLNPYGEPNDKRFSKIGLESIPKKAKPEILYFIGCTTAYKHPEIAISIIGILKRMGKDFTVMAESEQCCGSPLIRLGMEDPAKRLIKHNSETINSLECKIIVTGCPGCHRTLKEDYPRLGYKLDAEIMHVTEYLDSISKNISWNEFHKKVTYHDPCHLGRHSNIYDQPRNILQQVKGLKLLEMDSNKKNSNCCGSGGGLRVSYPNIAEKVGLKRLNEAYATGAELIATACPFCKDQIINVQNSRMQKEKELEIVDLTEILAHKIP
jgi:heterodisulfide reductase subunit D